MPIRTAPNRRARCLSAILLGSILLLAARPSAPPAVEAVILGIAQDGGVPHLGCRQELCVRARRDPSTRRLVASLGLVDHAAGRRFVIDATPDFAAQVDRLGGLPDAILLTHAHIGHYLGLAQLGREVLGAKRMPVYCTASMARFLRENRPWKRLVELENIEIHEVAAGNGVPADLFLASDRNPGSTPRRGFRHRRLSHLGAEPGASLAARHRQVGKVGPLRSPTSFRETAASRVRRRNLFLGRRDPGPVDRRHPPSPGARDGGSLRRGAPDAPSRAIFVHLNHTNRLLWDAAARRNLERKGFGIAREGERFPL